MSRRTRRILRKLERKVLYAVSVASFIGIISFVVYELELLTILNNLLGFIWG